MMASLGAFQHAMCSLLGYFIIFMCIEKRTWPFLLGERRQEKTKSQVRTLKQTLRSLIDHPDWSRTWVGSLWTHGP